MNTNWEALLDAKIAQKIGVALPGLVAAYLRERDELRQAEENRRRRFVAITHMSVRRRRKPPHPFTASQHWRFLAAWVGGRVAPAGLEVDRAKCGGILAAELRRIHRRAEP